MICEIVWLFFFLRVTAFTKTLIMGCLSLFYFGIFRRISFITWDDGGPATLNGLNVISKKS